MQLGADNMYYLLAGDYRNSSLFGLIPRNLGDAGSTSTALGNKIRQQLTTYSYDLDVPAAPPCAVL